MEHETGQTHAPDLSWGSAHLEVYHLKVLNEGYEQAAVVQLLCELGHGLRVRLLIAAPVQDLLHGHQAL